MVARMQFHVKLYVHRLRCFYVSAFYTLHIVLTWKDLHRRLPGPRSRKEIPHSLAENWNHYSSYPWPSHHTDWAGHCILDFITIRGLSGKCAVILYISSTDRVAIMYLGSQSEETVLCIPEKSLSREASQSAVRRRWRSLCSVWPSHS
jgi:hypothetical protein